LFQVLFLILAVNLKWYSSNFTVTTLVLHVFLPYILASLFLWWSMSEKSSAYGVQHSGYLLAWSRTCLRIIFLQLKFIEYPKTKEKIVSTSLIYRIRNVTIFWSSPQCICSKCLSFPHLVLKAYWRVCRRCNNKTCRSPRCTAMIKTNFLIDIWRTRISCSDKHCTTPQ